MALLAQRDRQDHRERRGQQAHPGQPGRKAPLDLPAPAWEPLARRVLPALPAPQDRLGHLASVQQAQLAQPGQAVPQALLARVLLEPQGLQGRLDPADHPDLADLGQRVLRGQLEPLGQAVQADLRGRLAPQARLGQQVQAVAAEASAQLVPRVPLALQGLLARAGSLGRLALPGRQVPPGRPELPELLEPREPPALRDRQAQAEHQELRAQPERPDLQDQVALRERPEPQERRGQRVRLARVDPRGHQEQPGRQEQRDQPDRDPDRQVELRSEITSDSNNELIYERKH
jgi:hypothetical protein